MINNPAYFAENADSSITTTFSAYNVVTLLKALLIVTITGHLTYPEQKLADWLVNKLIKN